MEGEAGTSDEQAARLLLERPQAESVLVPMASVSLELRLALSARERQTAHVAVDTLVAVQPVQGLEVVVAPRPQAKAVRLEVD